MSIQQQQDIEPTQCAITGRRVLIVFNLGIPVFLAYTGAAGIMYAQSISDGEVGSTATKQASSMVFQGIYMLMFAALLFIYECVQLCPCEFIDTALKRNFGFMYGVYGKAAYTFMIGVFAFGLGQPYNLVVSCAVIVAAYAPACIILHLTVPDLSVVGGIPVLAHILLFKRIWRS